MTDLTTSPTTTQSDGSNRRLRLASGRQYPMTRQTRPAPWALRHSTRMPEAPPKLDEVVFVGGDEGVELRPYTTRLPKQLVPLGEEHSGLEVALRQLASQGFRKATVATGTFGPIVRAYVGDGSQWGVQVDYVAQAGKLGSLGTVRAMLDQLPEHFVVVDGNVLTGLHHGDLLARHARSGSPLTVAVTEREHVVDFGVVRIDGGTLHGMAEQPRLRFPVAMGIYAISKSTLSPYPSGTAMELDDLVLDLVRAGRPPATYHYDGYYLNLDRPDDYERANREFATIGTALLPSV